MRKSRTIAGALIVAMAAGIGAGLVLVNTGRPGNSPLDRARAACADASAFERTVRTNGAASVAQQQLAEALVHARAAEALDPKYIPLESGLRTVQLALQHDDAGAANVGIRVVVANCKEVG